MSREYLREVYVTHVLDCLADPTKIRFIAELSEPERGRVRGEPRADWPKGLGCRR